MIKEFNASDQIDRIVTIKPSTDAAIAKLRKKNPEIQIKAIQIRLIKYQIQELTYTLATTLLEPKYPHGEFQDLYHSRWGIEELYKTTKGIMGTESFHSKNLRGVRQEVYAQLALITLIRIFTNHTDNYHNAKKSTHAL